MESSPASKPSKIRRLGKSIRNHARQARDAILPSSQALSLRSSSPHPSSTAEESQQPPVVSSSGLQGPGNVTSEPSSQHAVAASGTSLPAKYMEGLNVAWHGLQTALRVLEKSADVFPPLKSVVGGLVACLDIVQVSQSQLYGLLCSELFHRQPQAIKKTIKT